MKHVVSLFAVFCSLSLSAAKVTDHYAFSMSLQVPRIYANTESLGYRAYQSQRITGEMTITYDTDSERPEIAVTCLVNRVHKIGGKNISYTCEIDDTAFFPRVNLVGNNKTDKFRTPTIVFSLVAEPSYALESGEDNSLVLTLAGKGSTRLRNGARVIGYLRGTASGTLGCGCKAYGHVSPTRVACADGHSDIVDDVASAFGTWTARWMRRTTSENE